MGSRNQIPSSLVPMAMLLHLHLVSGGGESNVGDFIRTSCKVTLYPDVCYNSLYGYANAIQQDPAILVTSALKVSLLNAKDMAAYALNLTNSLIKSVSDPVTISALHDCVSVFRDASSQIRDSISQMKKLDGSGSESNRFGLSNVQTWMSSALTNENTCADSFDEVANGDLKMEISNRSKNVKQVTSNALALVNNYVAKFSPH